MNFDNALDLLIEYDKKDNINLKIFKLIDDMKVYYNLYANQYSNIILNNKKHNDKINEFIDIIINTLISQKIIYYLKKYNENYQAINLKDDIFNLWFRIQHETEYNNINLFKHMFYLSYNIKNKLIGCHSYDMFKQEIINKNITIIKLEKFDLFHKIEYINNDKKFCKTVFNNSPIFMILLGIIISYTFTPHHGYICGLKYKYNENILKIGYDNNNLRTFFFMQMMN